MYREEGIGLQITLCRLEVILLLPVNNTSNLPTGMTPEDEDENVCDTVEAT